MKKRALTAVATMAAMVLLAGCGSGGNGNDDALRAQIKSGHVAAAFELDLNLEHNGKTSEDCVVQAIDNAGLSDAQMSVLTSPDGSPDSVEDANWDAASKAVAQCVPPKTY